MDDFNITINVTSQLIVSENKGINSYSKKKNKKENLFCFECCNTRSNNTRLYFDNQVNYRTALRARFFD